MGAKKFMLIKFMCVRFLSPNQSFPEVVVVLKCKPRS